MQRFLVFLFVMFLFACGGKSKKAANTPRLTADPTERPGPTRDATADVTVTSSDGEDLSWLVPVYFDFDSSDLSSTTRDTLSRLHDWLAKHGGQTLTIEGHADEQGTTEYNVALGQRRAQAIVEYLGRLGTDIRRLRPVSFGDTRPAVDGHDEVAWAKNRRGEFRFNSN